MYGMMQEQLAVYMEGGAWGHAAPCIVILMVGIGQAGVENLQQYICTKQGRFRSGEPFLFRLWRDEIHQSWHHLGRTDNLHDERGTEREREGGRERCVFSPRQLHVCV